MRRISVRRDHQEEERGLSGKPKHINLNNEQQYNNMPCFGHCLDCMGQCCGCLRTWLPCIFCCCIQYPYLVVPQSYEGIYEKLGRYIRTVKPGLHFINPCTQNLGIINMKINVLNLERQTLITRDNVSIILDTSVYYRIINAKYAYYRVQEVNLAIAQVTYGILKNTCGQFTLQDLLEKRKQITEDLQRQVDSYVRDWGVDIQQILIKDIQLSHDLQESLSSAAKQRRLAESKLVAARADVLSAKLMRLAADELNSRSAMQIRYLQMLKMVGKHSSNVVFVPYEKKDENIQHVITQGLLFDNQNVIF